jgi:hypothetical protein
VLSSVPDLPQRPGTIISLARAATDRYIGTYEFVPGVQLAISRGENGALVAQASGSRDVWSFRQKVPFELQAVSPTEFVSTNSRRDRLMFTSDGVVLNPGPWEMRARRVP